MNERKRQVLVTAQQLFIEKGFSATSIQDILEESNISKGTFYNYFSSKNECLIAILEYVNEETFVRRREILIGQNLSDKKVLAEQIAIRMHINREQNLFLLFEAIFHSGDDELRDFVKKNHLAELFWLRDRLIDVYGKASAPYALDCAVLLLGMMQHIIHIWTASSKNLSDITELVAYVIRRIDAIVPQLIHSKDLLLDDDVRSTLARNIGDKKGSKDQLLTQLNGFHQKLDTNTTSSGLEYLLFLLEELKKDDPRYFLIETISHSFKEVFKTTPHEVEAREIAFKLWNFVDSTNTKE
ncbi:MAG: TetR/AcrR family transcriptional regulator [Bacillota bacterium]|uniref:TetR/AcrR family transcriptional regulator n=1 Tax=Virgibacillus salarius TaxID=447199 RepID=A0A941I928_9BACI|nr:MULTISPECIES: TetR/AcrR family transcriptional regulator [Bacillaceae]NAZ09002.1 TetR family transcriptional regulator [Agaribacter marinus]MBR7796294.1 TetR/AcrR family transcriptional regulator [Virgibacillus salarius]MCC2248526.1 TetR/AcrR family transcriptional regulator [Virgibacillus sp. AGTR]MDY7043039.1 TetR/AcrR family transcriptional regulator [Virgibacillus sp. M23]QRZ16613.1 TetR/AcrR family transcriptional regulator [Virgibacillus sp. AGTR]